MITGERAPDARPGDDNSHGIASGRSRGSSSNGGTTTRTSREASRASVASKT